MDAIFNISAEITCNGQIKYDTNKFNDAVKRLAKPETRNVRIIIINDFKNMTMKQLKYYHGFLLIDVCHAYESIGHRMNKVQADKEMRELFLHYYVTEFKSGRSSKKMFSLDTDSKKIPTTNEMSRFFEDIVRHCAMNMNYVIQLPDDIKDNNLNFNR